MAFPIVAVIILAGIFIFIAFTKDAIIPMLVELIVDFLICIIFLGVIGLWVHLPKVWVIALLLIGIAFLFFTHIARNKEGK